MSHFAPMSCRNVYFVILKVNQNCDTDFELTKYCVYVVSMRVALNGAKACMGA